MTDCNGIRMKIEADPFNVELQTELIQALRDNESSELHSCRLTCSSLFQLKEDFWLDWLTDSSKNKDLTNEVYKLAVVCCPQFGVVNWYLDHQISLFEDEELSEIELRQSFESAVTLCGVDIFSGSILFQKFREFEIEQHEELLDIANEANEDTNVTPVDIQKSKQRFIKLFHRQISLPLVGNEQTMQDFEKTLSEYCVASDESIIDPQSLMKKYEVAQEMRVARLPFEMNVNSEEFISSQDVNIKATAWLAYIAFEIQAKQLSRAQRLYERAVLDTPSSITLWTAYLEFACCALKNNALVSSIAARAIKVFRPLGLNLLFWKLKLEADELCRVSVEALNAQIQTALSPGGGLGSAEDYLELLLFSCDISRRVLQSAVSDVHASVVNVGLLAGQKTTLESQIAAIRSAYEYAETFLTHYYPDWISGFWRVYKSWATAEHFVIHSATALSTGGEIKNKNTTGKSGKKDIEKPAGVEIWEKAIHRFPTTHFVWQEYLVWVQSLPPPAGSVSESDVQKPVFYAEYCRRIYKRLLNVQFAEVSTEALAKEWLQFEQAYGTASDVNAVRIKSFSAVKSAFEAVVAQQQQYALHRTQQVDQVSEHMEIVPDITHSTANIAADKKRKRPTSTATDNNAGENQKVRYGLGFDASAASTTSNADNSKRVKFVEPTAAATSTMITAAAAVTTSDSAPPVATAAPSQQVVVRNLPFTATESDIKQFFEEKLSDDCGTDCVTTTELILSKAGTSRGIAHITLNSVRTMHKAVALLNQIDLNGRKIIVEELLTVDGVQVNSGKPVPKVGKVKFDQADSGSDAAPHLTTVFVSRLPATLTNEELKTHFSSCGEVLSARIAKDKKTGESKCNGLVQFVTEAGRNEGVKLHKTTLTHEGTDYLILVAPSRFSLVATTGTAADGSSTAVVDAKETEEKVKQLNETIASEDKVTTLKAKLAAKTTLAFKPRVFTKPK